MATDDKFDEELPPEVGEAMRGEEHLSARALADLSRELVTLRSESITARKESGIEEVWAAAEEAYARIDDANRSEGGTVWSKPSTMTGPVTTNAVAQKGEVKSTIFIPLTARYVDCAAAKIGEITLPAGDKAFSFDATPVPELISAKNDRRQLMQNGIPLERPARPEEIPGQPGASAPVGGAPALPGAPAPAVAPGTPTVPLTVADLAEEELNRAQASAKKAEKRVHDWMVESRYPAEMRKVIFDSARIGVGVLKGPFPRKQVVRAVTRDASGTPSVGMKVRIVPAYEWRDPWNIFPHRACGENIQNGDNIFERDFYSKRQLMKLKGTPGYIGAAIDKVIKEDPKSAISPESGNPNSKTNKHRYEVWFFHGQVPREALVASGAMTPAEASKSGEMVYALCTLVNDTVIRAVLNPLESGEFPYHAIPWQRRAGYWAGVGVGEQVSVAQRVINGASRTMMDNAGQSAGSITVLDRGSVSPADGNWQLTRNKLFYKAQDAVIDDVRKAFAFFQVPNVTTQLMQIVEYALRLAEESTSIPLVTQGQSGGTTPETFGATQLQNNNANQLLRAIGYAFDDYITEPVVRQSYEWLLLDDTVPDDEKGDWNIFARGTTAFVERAIQDQTISQMGALATNPVFGVNPKKWFAELLKSKHLNPINFQYTEEEQAEIDKRGTPPPPQVQVAQIRAAETDKKLAAEAQQAQIDRQAQIEAAHITAESRMQVTEVQEETARLRVQRDIDRDTKYVEAETARTQAEAQAKREELQLRERLAILEYANREKINLEQVRAQLAGKAMTLNVQRELDAAQRAADSGAQSRDHAIDLYKHNTSVAEPSGKAPAGESFTK